MSEQQDKPTLPYRAKRWALRRVTRVVVRHLPIEAKIGVVAAKGLLELAERQGWLDHSDPEKQTAITKLQDALKQANDTSSEFLILDQKTIQDLVGHTMEVRVVKGILHIVPGGKYVQKMTAKGAEKVVTKVLTAATEHHEKHVG